MVFSIRVYNERNALTDHFPVSSVETLNRFTDGELYRVMITLDDVFLRDLKDKVGIQFTDDSFFFKSIKIDKVSLTDRFDIDNRTTLWPNKIQLLRGKELKYLGKLTYRKERTVMQLKEILTSTGERGQAIVLVDWLCAESGCTNLSLSCTQGYCPDHCAKCEMRKECYLISMFKTIDHSPVSYHDLIRNVSDIEKKYGRLDEKTKRILLTYRIYDDFLKTLRKNGPLQVSRGVKFALVSKFLMEISNYFNEFFFECKNDIGKITRRLILDLCEWGVTKFMTSAKGYVTALVSTDHFAYGLFGTIEKIWRRCPNVIIVENTSGLKVCRSYYGGLFIQIDTDHEFWNWFQRLEAAIHKETSEQKSQKIGEKIYDEFGEEIVRAMGKRIKIIDYGGGTGMVLRAFLDRFLDKVPKGTMLEIKLIDVDKSSLESANRTVPEVLEKHGFYKKAFVTLKDDIFRIPIERADIAIVSQVLDLHTELSLSPPTQRDKKFSDPLIDLLENVLEDKMNTTIEGGQQWKRTLNIAESLLSPYCFMVAKTSGLIKEEFDPSSLYLLKLDFQSEKVQWVKEVARYSQNMIIVDRVVDAEQLKEWGIRVEEREALAQRVYISKSSGD